MILIGNIEMLLMNLSNRIRKIYIRLDLERHWKGIAVAFPLFLETCEEQPNSMGSVS